MTQVDLEGVDDETVLDDPDNPWFFNDMCNVVHVDEKWFEKMKVSRKCILGANEEAPRRHCKTQETL